MFLPSQVTERPGSSNRGEGEASTSEPQSIARMSTTEWRDKFEKDGMVDLWLEDEFNAGSRLVVRGVRKIAAVTRGQGWQTR